MTGPRPDRPLRAWTWTRLALLAALLPLSVGAGALAQGGSASPSPAAPASPGASVSPWAVAPWPSPVASPRLDVVFQPLPAVVAELPADIPTTSVAPTSEPNLVVGVPYPFTLGHCGLLSPIDLDGSLWKPVGGVSPSGGAIETDEDIGELINATEGLFTKIDEDAAEFRTAGGSLVELLRAPAELDYPLCM